MAEIINLRGINQADVERQFLQALQASSLKLSGRPIADGNFHRCDAVNKTRHRGKNDGSYVLHLDGVPRGAFINWTRQKEFQKWVYALDRPLSESERSEIDHSIESTIEEHHAELAKKHERARLKAKRLWRSAQEASLDHPYLHDKKLKDTFGLRTLYNGRLLVVPLWNEDKELQTLQFIYHDGDKRFLKGGEAGGCHYWIEKPRDTDDKIYICEGVATGASIYEAMQGPVLAAINAGNLQSVAVWAQRRYPKYKIIICADDDWQTEGNPGLKYAQNAARAVNGLVASPNHNQNDFNDLYNARGAKAVRAAIKAAKKPAQTNEEVIDALAKLDVIGYEQHREAAAKDLDIRISTLDEQVEKRRAELNAEIDKELLYSHWDVEAWPEAVDTADLLESLTNQINKYIATLGIRTIVPALWIMFSYIHESATHSPILLATSAEPDSGKSTLLGVINYLAYRALLTVNATGPMVFRSIEKWAPTLIVDEADTALANNNDLKEIINSGWTRGQGVIRGHHETHEPHLYSVFAPKVVGMKGKLLPDTTLSRTIILEMKRKQLSERVADFKHIDNEDLQTLRRQLVRWAADNSNILHNSDPGDPPNFNNRLRMNWWPLLALAELAGKAATKKTHQAIEDIETSRNLNNRASYGKQLLSDIRDIFAKLKIDTIHSEHLVAQLIADLEKPWADYKRNKPLSQKQVANMLNDFGIIPNDVYDADGDRARGYEKRQFEEAWQRYLSPPKDPPGDPPGDRSTLASSQNAANIDDPALSRSSQKSKNASIRTGKLTKDTGVLRGCEDQTPNRTHKRRYTHTSTSPASVSQT